MGAVEDVVTHLAAQVGLTAGASIFAVRLPDSPDTAMAVRETGGPAPEHTFGRRAWRTPTVQVVSRSTSAATARTNIDAAYTALDRHPGGTLASASTGSTYLSAWAMSEPISVGEDDAGRVTYTLNVILTRV